ncbi:hypothetical protein FBZ89_11986 [Nitrospirillum amazonense]|uniref:Uncharacterized protein n=1 Tax=Nitrospirillum amazonense TaxID=28077 RepID=A0A560EWX8_9PROT|nr:twin-arginine translocation signal domain-containing protein [Nitrospirillum amazonense]TWB13871.1 hypothetical protein FBZ89_11986 [Nitrospirillum amazonense]
MTTKSTPSRRTLLAGGLAVAAAPLLRPRRALQGLRAIPSLA